MFQVGLPLFLHKFGDLLVSFVGIVEDREGGETLTVGIARLSQKLFRLSHVVANSRLGSKARHGRSKGVGGDLSRLGHLFYQGLFIDRRGKGLPDQRIIKGFPLIIKAVVVGRQLGTRLVGRQKFYFVDDIQGNIGGPIDFTLLEHIVRGLVVGNSQDLNRAKLYILGVPIVGVFNHGNYSGPLAS